MWWMVCLLTSTGSQALTTNAYSSRDPCWVEDFLPKPSDVQVSVSLMPVSSSCFEAVSDSLRIQCGWIYNQRTWNTMHKHLLRISKYYFLALPQHI